MPDQRNVSHKACDLIVPCLPLDGSTFLESLSEKDKPWDKHRRNADIISNYYRLGGMDTHADRVAFCSQLLEFKVVPSKVLGQQKLKLASAKFCRVRHCPICRNCSAIFLTWGLSSLLWQRKTSNCSVIN